MSYQSIQSSQRNATTSFDWKRNFLEILMVRILMLLFVLVAYHGTAFGLSGLKPLPYTPRPTTTTPPTTQPTVQPAAQPSPQDPGQMAVNGFALCTQEGLMCNWRGMGGAAADRLVRFGFGTKFIETKVTSGQIGCAPENFGLLASNKEYDAKGNRLLRYCYTKEAPPAPVVVTTPPPPTPAPYVQPPPSPTSVDLNKVPQGPYAATCMKNRMEGTTLIATCNMDTKKQMGVGFQKESRLTNAAGHADIENCDGELRFEGCALLPHTPEQVPPGPYKVECYGFKFLPPNGTTLGAVCPYNANGSVRVSALANASDIKQDVYSCDGILTVGPCKPAQWQPANQAMAAYPFATTAPTTDLATPLPVKPVAPPPPGGSTASRDDFLKRLKQFVADYQAWTALPSRIASAKQQSDENRKYIQAFINDEAKYQKAKTDQPALQAAYDSEVAKNATTIAALQGKIQEAGRERYQRQLKDLGAITANFATASKAEQEVINQKAVAYRQNQSKETAAFEAPINAQINTINATANGLKARLADANRVLDFYGGSEQIGRAKLLASLAGLEDNVKALQNDLTVTYRKKCETAQPLIRQQLALNPALKNDASVKSAINVEAGSLKNIQIWIPELR